MFPRTVSLLGLVVVLFLLPQLASAEGRCPPGQYPVGSQGVGGCAPIPTSGGGDSAPVATGRWHKTWGAFALSEEGAAGAVVGKRKKSDASSEAVRNCASNGSRSCKVAFAFHNQCGAAVVPTSGSGGTLFGRAETVDKAEKIAMDLCSSQGGVGCNVIFSDCSKPEFEEF